LIWSKTFEQLSFSIKTMLVLIDTFRSSPLDDAVAALLSSLCSSTDHTDQQVTDCILPYGMNKARTVLPKPVYVPAAATAALHPACCSRHVHLACAWSLSMHTRAQSRAEGRHLQKLRLKHALLLEAATHHDQSLSGTG
jgi:hypothetical protein